MISLFVIVFIVILQTNPLNYIIMKRFYVVLFILIAVCSCQNNEVVDSIVHEVEQDGVTRAASSSWRRLTQEEKTILKEVFPSLNVNTLYVTDEATSVYNCIAFSMGLTNTWINPEMSLDMFRLQYLYAQELYGAPSNFVPLGPLMGSAVDGWGLSTYEMAHASAWQDGEWQSKLGEYLRITHEREGLEGEVYGKIWVSFDRRSYKMADDYKTLSNIAAAVNRDSMTLASSQKTLVREKATMVDAATKARFDSLVVAWRTAIDNDIMMKLSPSTKAYTQLSQFDKLKEMGEKIIPLIMERLLNRDNFYLLQLYDAVQSDESLIIKYEDYDVRMLEGEQNRAKRTIAKWLDSL